jgi:hypothetical protein
MIHGVYVKNRPKSKWLLVSTTPSAEVAIQDRDEALKQAQLDGHEQADVAIRIFESVFYIPESLTEIKKQEPQYN